MSEEQKEITESSNEEEAEEEEEEEENTNSEGDGHLAIDLIENEVYRGICTLFEDEDGNNILEYISLLHTELIGINKSVEYLKGIRKDIGRIADCAEQFLKLHKPQGIPNGIPEAPSKEVRRVKKTL